MFTDTGVRLEVRPTGEGIAVLADTRGEVLSTWVGMALLGDVGEAAELVSLNGDRLELSEFGVIENIVKVMK